MGTADSNVPFAWLFPLVYEDERGKFTEHMRICSMMRGQGITYKLVWSSICAYKWKNLAEKLLAVH